MRGVDIVIAPVVDLLNFGTFTRRNYITVGF